jgi:hypothetical protein
VSGRWAPDGVTARDIAEVATRLRDPGGDGPPASRAVADLLRALVGAPALPLPACGAPALAIIRAAAEAHGGLGQLVAAIERFAFGGEDTFDGRHETAHARILYRTTGPGHVDPHTGRATVRVPYSDPPHVLAELPDDPGTPTYVRRLGVYLEHAFGVFARQFGLPDPTGGGQLPVTVRIEAQRATATERGIVLTPGFNDALLCAYTGHELFHVFQFALAPARAWVTSGPLSYELFEGGAVFAEDAVADGMNRYLLEAGAWFNGPGLLDDPGLPLIFSGYKAALFWRYLVEQAAADASRPALDVFTRILRDMVPGRGPSDLERVVEAEAGMRGTRCFSVRRAGNDREGDTISAETLFGNFGLACRLKDVRQTTPDRRFTFAEVADKQGFYQAVTGVERDPPRIARMAVSGPWQLAADGVSFAASVGPFAHRLLELAVTDGVPAVDVAFGGGPALAGRSILQLVGLNDDGIREVLRWDTGAVRRRLTVAHGGQAITRLVLILSGTALPGDTHFWVSVTHAPASPDVIVTPMNCRPGVELELDPRLATWKSPDITTATGDPVIAGADNALAVTVRNRGGVPAEDVGLELAYQAAAPHALRAGAWLDLRDGAGRPQHVAGLRIGPGAMERVEVAWAPPPDLGGATATLRVRVRAPGDPNRDNKVALSTLECRPARG